MSNSSLPNLLVIGAMKCGSTSLHDYLNQHPDIFMSDTKELNFFIKESNWDEGIEWYKNQFKSTALWRGESSISYTKAHEYKGVPDRIYDVLGKDVKLIYLLRDPIQRFQSNFTDGKTYRDIPPDYSINEYAKIPDNPYLMTSRYAFQLEFFIKKFSLDQILVVTTEKLEREPLKVLNEIADFLDIDHFDDFFVSKTRLNASSEKKYKNKTGEQISGSPLITKFKQLMPSNAIRKVSGSRIYKKLVYNKINRELDHLNHESIAILEDYFRDEMDSLRKLTKMQFEDWQV